MTARYVKTLAGTGASRSSRGVETTSLLGMKHPNPGRFRGGDPPRRGGAAVLRPVVGRDILARMTDDIRKLLVRELRAFAREVEMFPDDESLFRTVPGVTNSAGNLALHVCGNLQHFVGAVLGGTGYERNRELEFQARSGHRADIARQLHETAAVVTKALGQLSSETLDRPYPQRVADLELPCRLFLIHLAVHLGFHLGQAGYLRRIVSGDGRSSGPVSLKELTER